MGNSVAGADIERDQGTSAAASAAEATALAAKPTGFAAALRAEQSDGAVFDDVASRLQQVRWWVEDDLERVDAELDEVRRNVPALHPSARHLLGLRGKHLRPMCVVIATRLGGGFREEALDLAVAAELIHCATLLHDDVIDDADRRRGAPAARVLNGNAESILSGDWMLIRALQRVRRAGSGELLDGALATIEQMIEAEAIQLASRGRLDTARVEYFRVIEGKTAALFRWALSAGAWAGALPDSQRRQLEAFGDRIGTAFQMVDDVLDFDGDPAITGKAVFTDLREGGMTYPLLLALERDPALPEMVEEILAQPAGEPTASSLVERVVAAVHATGGVEDCLEVARQRVDEAVACLGPLPRGRAQTALITLAEAVLYRAR